MRRSYIVAMELAEEFVEKFLHGGKSEIAGSLRRNEPTIGDVDIITSLALQEVEYRIAKNVYARKLTGKDKKMIVEYKCMQFDIFHSELGGWGAMLFFLTGPAGYGIAYRRIAKAKGWKLDQYGLWNKDGEIIASRTEHDIFKAFGKEYKEPEQRGQ